MENYQGESRLMDTVRDNPMPLALIGLGLGWLMVSGIRSARSEGMAATGGSDYEGARRGMGYGRPQGGAGAYESGYGSYDSSDYGGADYAGYTEYATGAGYEAQSPARHVGGGRAEDLRERASSTARNVRERTARMTGRISERAQEWAGSARHRVSSAGRTVRSQASHLAERSTETYQEHPLMLGSMALLIGAALGAALPRTRSEDEMMGETRDELMHRARAAGEDTMEKAKTVASRTAEAARESGQEALERVKDAAKHSAEDVVETAKRSAKESFEHVKDTAQNEAEKQNLAGGSDTGRLH